MKSRAFTLLELLAVIVVLAIIALIVTPFVTKSIKSAQKGAAENSASNLIVAAEEYYASKLIKNNGFFSDVTLTYVNGVSQDEDFEFKGTKPTNGSITISQDGIVTLTNLEIGKYVCNGGNKISTNCVDSSIPKPNLISKLLVDFIENENVINDESIEAEYLFYGDATNNYLWYGGHEWRIVSFNTFANTIKLILAQPLTAIAWGDYTDSSNNCIYNETCNTIEKSYIGSWLGEGENGVFLKSLRGTDIYDKIIPTKYSRKIYNGFEVILTESEKVKTRLLTEDEYTKAGMENSYLNIDDFFWLSDIKSRSMVSIIYDNEFLYFEPNKITAVRPVITISDIAVDVEGFGSQNNPYTVLTDDIAETFGEVKIGDYIKVPCNNNSCSDDGYWTVRVVNKDTDSVKVVLNGLYSNTSFNETNITNGLTSFLSTIDIASTTPKVFNVGSYSNGYNYTSVKDETYNGFIGLPTIAEMFSANDIDMGYGNKRFANINIIENPTYSWFYWLMNPYGDNMCASLNYGHIDSHAINDGDGGIRPTFFLNKSLKLVNGSGSPIDPYVINSN